MCACAGYTLKINGIEIAIAKLQILIRYKLSTFQDHLHI
jgi:hypothetical protein